MSPAQQPERYGLGDLLSATFIVMSGAASLPGGMQEEFGPTWLAGAGGVSMLVMADLLLALAIHGSSRGRSTTAGWLGALVISGIAALLTWQLGLSDIALQAGRPLGGLGSLALLAAAAAVTVTALLSPAHINKAHHPGTYIVAVSVAVCDGYGHLWLAQGALAPMAFVVVGAAWVLLDARCREPAALLKAAASSHFAFMLFVVISAHYSADTAATVSLIGLLVLVQLALLSSAERQRQSRGRHKERRRGDRYRSLLGRERDVRKAGVQDLLTITDNATIGIVEIQLDGTIVHANPAFLQLVCAEHAHELVGQPLSAWIRADDHALVQPVQTEAAAQHPMQLQRSDGKLVEVLLSRTTIRSYQHRHVLFFNDVTPMREAEALRKRMETELRLSHKLEAVGKLAAGIAHEINTPVQYVSDSIHFIRTASLTLDDAMRRFEAMLAEGQEQLRDEVADISDDCEVEFYRCELPAAFDRALDGLKRVSEIVQSMKQLAFADRQDLEPCDLNKILSNASIMARHEYAHIAELVLELGENPELMGRQGELTQVFVNFIVNAGHAIADSGKFTADSKGRIIVRTAIESRRVRIFVEDNGCGIPDVIRGKIFDPYFTTKEVGRGSGQGLAISRGIIVNYHGGSLTIESTEGEGTTFEITLPTGARDVTGI